MFLSLWLVELPFLEYVLSLGKLYTDQDSSTIHATPPKTNWVFSQLVSVVNVVLSYN